MSDYGYGDPRTAAMIQMILQLAQAGGGGGITTPLDQLSFGYEPSEMQNFAQQGTIPQSSSDDPLKAYAAQANALQDTADLMMDQALIGGGGPGSYAPDAFAPTITYEPVSTPTTDLLMSYAQQEQAGGVPTLEGRMAIALLGLSPDGQTMSASEFVNSIAQVWAAGSAPGATDEQKAEMESWRPLLQTYLFTDSNDPTETEQVSWSRVAERLYPLEIEFKAEPKPGQSGQVLGPDGEVISQGGNYIVGADGQLLREIVEESPLAEQFHEAGYSLPTDQYTPESLMSGDWQQAASLYEQSGLGAETAGPLDITESAAQRWLDTQAGILPARGQLAGQGPATTPAAAVGDQGPPMVGVLPAAGGVPATPEEMAAIAGMNGDGVLQFLDDHPALPLDQLQTIEDMVASGSIEALNTPQYAQLAAEINDRRQAVTPPADVTTEQMDAYNQALEGSAAAQVVAPGGHYPEATLGAVMDLPDTDDPTVLQNWLISSWGAMTDEQRQTAVDTIQGRSDEQVTLLAGSEDPGLVAQREAWARVGQSAQDLLDAGTVAEWNRAQVGGAGTPGMGGPIFGGGGGESALAGLNLTGAPPNATPPTASPFPDTGTQAAAGGMAGGMPAAQTQGLNPATTMAMLQAVLPGFMTNSPMLPAVLGQVANGGNVQPPTQPQPQISQYAGATTGGNPTNAMQSALLRSMQPSVQPSPGPQGTPPTYSVTPGPYPAQPTAPGQSNAVMSALLRQMMPGGTMPNPGTPGPPSNPNPLPTWMAGATPPSTIQPTQPAGPTQGQGSEALLLAMMRAAQGGMESGVGSGLPYTMSAQNQETAGQTGAGFGTPPAAMQADGGQNFYQQAQARQTVGNIGGLFGAGPQIRDAGQQRYGQPRPASKYSTPQLRSGAEGRVNQWLAEDRRIRQLRDQVYGADYQRARVRSSYFQQRGITPYIVENANRRGTLANMGLGQ